MILPANPRPVILCAKIIQSSGVSIDEPPSWIIWRENLWRGKPLWLSGLILTFIRTELRCCYFLSMRISTNLQWSTFYFRYIYYIRLAKFADLQQGIINRETNKQTNKETNKAQRETNLFSSRIMYLLLSP